MLEKRHPLICAARYNAARRQQPLEREELLAYQADQRSSISTAFSGLRFGSRESRLTVALRPCVEGTLLHLLVQRSYKSRVRRGVARRNLVVDVRRIRAQQQLVHVSDLTGGEQQHIRTIQLA